MPLPTDAPAPAAPLVVRTADGRRPPRAPGGRGWIWAPSGRPTPEAVTAAARAGAYDTVWMGGPGAKARLEARLAELAVPEPPPPATALLISDSETGRALKAEIARAARTSQPVLLLGETGTGKEVAARLIHEWSARAGRTFVPINCAAIPNDLLESELFGYTRGAFSGAARDYDGQIAAAEGGTVFLDEVDDTPLPFQVKLLRVLEDRVVSRLGENKWRKVDFRIVAASNRELRPLVASGAFGGDLYERLAVVCIRMPPLRERTADIPALVTHFIRRYADEAPSARARDPVERATPEALAALAAYPWPGNVRELRNVIFEALVGKRAGRELLLSDLPRRVWDEAARAPAGPAAPTIASADSIAAAIAQGTFDLKRAIASLERAALQAALAQTAGNAARAATLLGNVGRGAAKDPGGTVRAMMKRLGVK